MGGGAGGSGTVSLSYSDHRSAAVLPVLPAAVLPGDQKLHVTVSIAMQLTHGCSMLKMQEERQEERK